MGAIGLTVIDWIIILIYFGFVIGIGFYLRKFTTSEGRLFFSRQKKFRVGRGFSFSLG